MKKKTMPPVMILCGGKGTRMRELSELLPKPMVLIGEQPILWHIMKSYAAFGIKRFILCLGYKREVFIDYFMNYHLRTNDATITLGHNPEIRFHGETEEADWQVTLAGTGLETMTGGRIRIASKYLDSKEDTFFVTYGDGVADIDLKELLERHQKSGKMLTVSAVHPAARFGEMNMRGDDIINFDEKPVRSSGYINGGFMVMNRKFIEKYLNSGKDEFLEAGPMHTASKNHDLNAYRHEGFWQCMDTPRENALLNKLWDSGKAPWTKFWK